MPDPAVTPHGPGGDLAPLLFTVTQAMADAATAATGYGFHDVKPTPSDGFTGWKLVGERWHSFTAPDGRKGYSKIQGDLVIEPVGAQGLSLFADGGDAVGAGHDNGVTGGADGHRLTTGPLSNTVYRMLLPNKPRLPASAPRRGAP